MNDNDINILRAELQKSAVLWLPDSQTVKIVTMICHRAEEDDLADDGDGGLCAVFLDGSYVSLDNVTLSDFATIERLA